MFAHVGHPGIGFWKQSEGGLLYGNIMWGIGVRDWLEYVNGTVRGSAVYSQNEGGMARIVNHISFRNETAGMKVFGETGAVRDFQQNSNIIFQVGVTVDGSSGSTATSNLWYDGNVTMGHPFLSYVSLSNRETYYINNFTIGGSIPLKEHTDSFITNNTLWWSPGLEAQGGQVSFLNTTTPKAQMNTSWNWNTYYVASNGSPWQFAYRSSEGAAFNSASGGILGFVDGTNSWSAWSGFDSNSVFLTNWPVQVRQWVFPNVYNPNRWHVAVVSHGTGSNAVNLDLSSMGFSSGQRYQLIDAQNWPVVIVSGTYTGSALSLPLTLTNVSTINGTMATKTNEHTNIDNPGLFNAFVLERTSTNAVGSVQISGNVNINGNVTIGFQ